MVTEAQVREALSHVNDPHIPVSLERMAMLRGISISDDGTVDVQLCIPCMSCPGVSMLKEQITNAVSQLPGVISVRVHEGWHHTWTADMLDGETRNYMRKYGVHA